MSESSGLRTRWAAIGAAVAVTLGAVGIGSMNIASADISSGDRPVFVAVDGCRLVDTRSDPTFNVGDKTSPFGPNETLTVTAHGSNGRCTGADAIPTDALGLSLNVTAVDATVETFVTVWGEGADPGTSNLNPAPGQPPTPNAVNTPLSPTGTFKVRNNVGNVNLIIDVTGYYADHNHDDRYYTEAEVDARIAAAATQWVRLAPDGTVVASSPGVTGEEYVLPTGRVVARFGRDVSTCAYAVTVTQDFLGEISQIAVSGEDIGTPIGDDAVFVYTTVSGNPTDTEISLTVNC